MSDNTENQGITRRNVVKGAAWSVPVIAVAVATPLAAASGPTETDPPKIPIACTKAGKNMWTVAYNDGTSETLHQGQVDRDKTLQALCRGKGPQS